MSTIWSAGDLVQGWVTVNSRGPVRDGLSSQPSEHWARRCSILVEDSCLVKYTKLFKTIRNAIISHNCHRSMWNVWLSVVATVTGDNLAIHISISRTIFLNEASVSPLEGSPFLQESFLPFESPTTKRAKTGTWRLGWYRVIIWSCATVCYDFSVTDSQNDFV